MKEQTRIMVADHGYANPSIHPSSKQASKQASKHSVTMREQKDKPVCIDDLISKRADGHVGLLRNEEDAISRWQGQSASHKGHNSLSGQKRKKSKKKADDNYESKHFLDNEEMEPTENSKD